MLPKCACILLRRKSLFVLFDVIIYLYYGYFIRFWNQINILCWNGFHCSSSQFYQSQLIMNIETLLYSVHYSNWLFLNSNQDQRWKRDSSHSEDISSTKAQGSMNIFSNDGSFLDQFKKLSGVKGEQENCHSRLKKRVFKTKWCIVVPRKTSHFRYTSLIENEVLAQADTVAPLIRQYSVYVTLLLMA